MRSFDRASRMRVQLSVHSVNNASRCGRQNSCQWRNQSCSQENEKNTNTLDTVWAHAVTINDVPSLERFQVHPIGKFH